MLATCCLNGSLLSLYIIIYYVIIYYNIIYIHLWSKINNCVCRSVCLSVCLPIVLGICFHAKITKSLSFKVEHSYKQNDNNL